MNISNLQLAILKALYRSEKNSAEIAVYDQRPLLALWRKKLMSVTRNGKDNYIFSITVEGESFLFTAIKTRKSRKPLRYS